MVAIIDLGNMSPTVEKIFADHDWCAAQAMPTNMTGNQYEYPDRGWARSASSGKKAKINIARMRPA